MIAIFLFYDEGRGKQRIFTRGSAFKHCDIIIYDGDVTIAVQAQPEGIGLRRINSTNIVSIMRNLKIIPSLIAMVCVEVMQRKKLKWFPLQIKSCNELCRIMSGIDVGVTFNPIHLYNKLIKFSKLKNYDLLYLWNREIK